MEMFFCGSFTGKQNKPCKHCKNFIFWGIFSGYCVRQRKNVSCSDHCKYFKRDAEIWTKNGECKVDENSLYV
jgi:hypothetical protein